ncbi:MAG: hypothetical protein KAI47_27865, partial [Deltaproteobacteria bacterium]|nr:hypothetical protein [Deltaproteobacteria bacterium]
DHAVPLPDVHVRPDHPATSSCKVTLCMAGAVKLTDGWNPLLADLCKDLPGIIMNGSSPLFRMDQSTAALDRAIAALDTSGNGSVDSNDKQCEFRIVGYSWGGINANGIARDFLKDYRVSLSRRVVHKLIVIDPYRPGTSIKVPFGVVDFWEYRHTKSPSKDCSRNDWGGPYKGIRPKCQATVRCRDYDFSLAPYEKFGSYSGSQVGHCTVINAAYWAVIHNLKWGKDYFRVPPKVPIVTFN